jgi:hypothetical protein
VERGGALRILTFEGDGSVRSREIHNPVFDHQVALDKNA